MRCYQREFDSSLDSGAGLCVAPAGWTLCRPLPLLWNLELKPCVTHSLQAHGWQSRIIVLLTCKLFTCSRALYLNSQDTFRRSFIHSSPPFWSWTLCRSRGLDCVSPVPSSLESGAKTLCHPFAPSSRMAESHHRPAHSYATSGNFTLLCNLELDSVSLPQVGLCVAHSLQAHGWQSRVIILLTCKFFICSRSVSQLTGYLQMRLHLDATRNWTLCLFYGANTLLSSGLA